MHRFYAPLGTIMLLAIVGILVWTFFTQSIQKVVALGQVVPDQEQPFETNNTTETVAPARKPDVYFQAILDRPLFAPNRRQNSIEAVEEEIVIESAPVEEVQQQTLPEGMALRGILGAGADRAAMLETNQIEADWLRTGDLFGGWKITDIGPDWVTITLGSDQKTLELFK